MNEKSHHNNIEPELEARIAAMVLGEASDFESDQLRDLIAARPELAELQEQLQRMHQLMQIVGSAELEADDADWKLPEDRREVVLATLRGEQPETQTLPFVQKRSQGMAWVRKVSRIAAIFCLVAFVGLMGIFVLSMRHFQLSASRVLSLGTQAPPAANDRRYLDRENSQPFAESDSGFYGGTAATQSFDSVALAEADFSQDSQSSLAAIEDSLRVEDVQSVLKDDIQYTPAIPQIKLQGESSTAWATDLHAPGGAMDAEMAEGIVLARPSEPIPADGSILLGDLGSSRLSELSQTMATPHIVIAEEEAAKYKAEATDAAGRQDTYDLLATRGLETWGTPDGPSSGSAVNWPRFERVQSPDDASVFFRRSREESPVPEYTSPEQAGEFSSRSRSVAPSEMQAGDSGRIEGLDKLALGFEARTQGFADEMQNGLFGGGLGGGGGGFAGGGYGGEGSAGAVAGRRSSRDGEQANGENAWREFGDSAVSRSAQGIASAQPMQAELEELAKNGAAGATHQWYDSEALHSGGVPANAPMPNDDSGQTPALAAKESLFGVDTNAARDAKGLSDNLDGARGTQVAAGAVVRELHESNTQPDTDAAAMNFDFGFAADSPVAAATELPSINRSNVDEQIADLREKQLSQHALFYGESEPYFQAGQMGANGLARLGRLPSASFESKKLTPANKVIPAAGLEESLAGEEAFSTFSLHVSDVSFKLAQAALAQSQWPESARIRIEEFVNAFDYGDPLPSEREKVACVIEQSVHPFLQQRNLLRISMRTSAAGRANDTPLRLTLLLDNSGSMERYDRQQTVRRALALLAQSLKPMDQVTLISFARQPRLLADRIAGSEIQRLLQLANSLPSEGGTNIEAALQLAFEKALEQQLAGAQNRIILLTDGAVNLGDANPNSLSQWVTTMRESGIAFDAAGISAEGLNDEILEALTRQGDGRYYLLDSADAADDGFAQQIAGALRPSAKNVKVQVEFNPKRVGHYKLLGFEKHLLKQEDFRNDKVDAAEMAAAEAGVAVYHFEAKAEGEGDVGSVSVRFRDMSTGQMVEKRWPIPYEADAPRPEQAAPSMRIAASAALLAAKLQGSALAESVDLKSLAELISGLPEKDRNVPRVQQLQQMIGQARQLIGN